MAGSWCHGVSPRGRTQSFGGEVTDEEVDEEIPSWIEPDCEAIPPTAIGLLGLRPRRAKRPQYRIWLPSSLRLATWSIECDVQVPLFLPHLFLWLYPLQTWRAFAIVPMIRGFHALKDVNHGGLALINMKKIFLISNIIGVVVAISSIFILPRNTPIWQWSLGVMVFMVSINSSTWWKFKNNKREDPKETRENRILTWIAISIIMIIIILMNAFVVAENP